VTSSSTSFEDLCPETPKYTEVQYRCANTTSGSSGDSVDRQQLRFRDDKISRVWEPVVVKHVSQSDILLSLNTSRGIVSVSSNISNISNSRNASAKHLNSLADSALLESSATVTAQESETVAPMIVDAAETGNTTQDQSLVASQEENYSNTATNEEKEELSEKKVITIAVVVCASLTVLLIVLSLTSSKVIII
jgi:hypothetical protein